MYSRPILPCPLPWPALLPAGYRLRHATLLFQTGDPAAARRMMQGIVRKNGNYAEAHAALAAVEWAQVGAQAGWAGLGGAGPLISARRGRCRRSGRAMPMGAFMQPVLHLSKSLEQPNKPMQA